MTNDELHRLATHVSGDPYADYGGMESHVAATVVADAALVLLADLKWWETEFHKMGKGITLASLGKARNEIKRLLEVVEHVEHLHQLDHSLADQWEKKNESLMDEVKRLGTIVTQQLRKLIVSWDDAELLRELIVHMWVHDGYERNGYRQMTTEQKALYSRTTLDIPSLRQLGEDNVSQR